MVIQLLFSSFSDACLEWFDQMMRTRYECLNRVRDLAGDLLPTRLPRTNLIRGIIAI